MKRDFRLKDLPHDTQGTILYAGTSQESYHKYVAWLAQYLHTAVLPEDVENNPELAGFHSGDPCNLAGTLGMQAAWREDDSVNAWVAQQVLDGQRDAEDDPAPTQLTDAEREELLSETAQERAVLGEYVEDFLDVGWRIPLALLIRRVETETERVRLLQTFFSAYQEESRK